MQATSFPPNTGKKIGAFAFEGGDGSSREKAIKIKGAKNSPEGIKAEYAYLKLALAPKSFATKKQALMGGEDGKKYDALTVIVDQTTEYTFYFDITDFFGLFLF